MSLAAIGIHFEFNRLFMFCQQAHVVEEQMTREEAFKHCSSIQRKLAQPKSQSENQFYGDFGRKFLLALKQNVNGTKISNVDKITIPNISKGSALEKQFKDAKVSNLMLDFNFFSDH